LPLTCAELDLSDKFFQEQNTGKLDVVLNTNLSCLTLLPMFGEFVTKETDIFLSLNPGMLKTFSFFFCFVYLMKLIILWIYLYLSVCLLFMGAKELFR
jgi:hypothetical protein